MTFVPRLQDHLSEMSNMRVCRDALVNLEKISAEFLKIPLGEPMIEG
jgi:hypothetical protein